MAGLQDIQKQIARSDESGKGYYSGNLNRSELYATESRNNCMYPIWQFLKITLEHLPINHAEKQTCLLIVYRIVVDVSSIDKHTNSVTIEQ